LAQAPLKTFGFYRFDWVIAKRANPDESAKSVAKSSLDSWRRSLAEGGLNPDLAASKAAVVANALLEFADFGFKPSNRFFGIGQLATFFEQSVLEFTNPLLKTDPEACASSGLNGESVQRRLLIHCHLRAAVEGRFAQSRPFARRAIDQRRRRCDLAESLKLEQRLRSCGAIKNVLTKDDQPVHLRFRDHRGLRPNYLVGRQHVLSVDLGGVRPFANLFERNGSEDLTAIVLSQKPIF
jgi:hypothetical protein